MRSSLSAQRYMLHSRTSFDDLACTNSWKVAMQPHPLCAAYNCQPKVANLDGPIAVTEEVVWFDVHDNHVVRMQECQPLRCLPEHLPHSGFRQQLSLLLSLHHRHLESEDVIS